MIRREDLAWSAGNRSFELDGWRFSTVHGGGGEDELVPGENCFLFYKTRLLVEEYLNWLGGLAEPPASDRIVELGLFDGGSVPFWFELFRPKKHLGVDLRPAAVNHYLDEYLSEGGRRERIALHWGTSQDDAVRIPALVDEAFQGAPIDLVIDDASHLYDQTRASFELLFPRLRLGGYYIIEDWAWAHWRGTEQNFRGCRPLTDLVAELIEVMGSTSYRVILNMHVSSGFAAIRRGWTPAEELGEFRLDRFRYRHPR